MSNSYQIGLASDALINLTDDPFPTNETEQVGFTLSGTPINIAMENISWKWKIMSQEGWYQLYLFWVNNIQAANPPPYVYIRTLSPSGVDFTYGIYRCKMGKPKSEITTAVAEVRDAEINFYQCEQVA